MARKKKDDVLSEDKPLTPQEKLFVDAYIQTANIQEAGRMAKYKMVDKQAYAVFHRPRVQKAIEARREEMMFRLGINPERVLAEWSKMAFSDLSELVEIKGPLVLLKPDADLSKLSEIICNSEGIKYKLHDKKAALDAISKHLGLFEKDNDQQVKGIADAIREAAAARKKGSEQ